MIKPAQVRPPEATVLGARDVFRRVGSGMVAPVICNPTGRMPRAIKDCTKDQHLFDDLVDPKSAMRQNPVVTDRCGKTADRGEKSAEAKQPPAGQREENKSDTGQHVYQDEVEKNPGLAARGFPERPFPGPNLWNSRLVIIEN